MKDSERRLIKMKEVCKKQFDKEKKEENPFKNYPLGIWMGSYSHFCPECGKPVPICTCGTTEKKTKNVKAD